MEAEFDFCFRDAPYFDFEAIRQHERNMKPYMLTVQYIDDIF